MRTGKIVLFLLVMVHAVPAVELRLSGYIPYNFDTTYISREYDRISKVVGLVDTAGEPEPLSIFFYKRSEQRLTGIRLPEWGGGGVLGRDSIVLPVDRPSAFYASDRERILVHELVHIALIRAYGHLRLPRWFHEGLAMSLSGEFTFEEQLYLSRAIIFQSLLPLDSLEHLNRLGHTRATVAYAEAHFAVQLLITTYGIDFVADLLQAAKRTRTFDEVLSSVVGLRRQEFEQLVHAEMVKRYRFLFIVADTSLFWIGIFILAVVAFVVTRVRNHRRKRIMVLEEDAVALSAADEGTAGSGETGTSGSQSFDGP